MDAPENPDQFDDEADYSDELDMTEDEFDARMAAGQPALLIGFAAKAQLKDEISDYYTIQMSDSSIVRTSFGSWGGARWSIDDRQGAIPSAV